MWLVSEVRKQSFPDACSPALALYVLCERFRWHLEHPPWPDGLLEGMLMVAPFFLGQQQAEMAEDAYRR